MPSRSTPLTGLLSGVYGACSWAGAIMRPRTDTRNLGGGLQGDGTATDTADAEADGEAPSDEYDWSDDPAAGASDDNDYGDS